MTLQESSFLLDSDLNLVILVNTDLGTDFYAQAHFADAKQLLKITITSYCIADVFLPIEEISLTHSPDRSTLT